MNEARLDIGALTLRVEGGKGVQSVMAMPGMAVFACDSEPTITLTLDADIVPPAECRVLHRFEIADGNAECCFSIDAEGVYYYSFSFGGLLRIDPRTPDRAQCSSIGNPHVLRFAVWLAYSMMGAAHGRVPIHSSTVAHRGRAVLCLGESGIGKSTHTRLWLNNIPDCHLLNDDSPILAITPDGVEVYGSPWSGKTHCYRHEHYPVAAFLRLKQRPQNSITRLPVLEAFSALQPSLPPAMAHDELLLDKHVEMVSHMVATTPVFLMGCLPDAEAAQMSHNAIFRHNDN